MLSNTKYVLFLSSVTVDVTISNAKFCYYELTVIGKILSHKYCIIK